MKKKLLVSPLIVLIVISILSCNKESDSTMPDMKEQQQYCKDPLGLLTSEEANRMEDFYKKNQYAVINKYFAKENEEYRDNRNFWYSLEELECYFSYIKEKGEALGYDPSAMGVRIYLGAIPDKKFRNSPKTKLFFVPTGSKNNNFIGAQNNINEINPKNLGDTDGGEY